MTTKARELLDVGGQGLTSEPSAVGAGGKPIEESDLLPVQRRLWCSRGIGAASQRQPEDPPCDDAEQREEIGYPFGGLQAGLFRPATRLQDLVEGLDLPPHGVPADLLECFLARAHRQVSQELPLDWLATTWRIPLGDVQDREVEGG